MAKRTRYSTGLKAGHDAQLPFTDYNRSTENVISSRPVEAPVEALFLGEQHKISSGGENVFFTNLSSDIDWFPPWSGIKNQLDPVNRDITGIIQTSTRTYSPNLIDSEFRGPPLPGTVDYTAMFTLPFNMSVFGIEFVIRQDIEPEDYLFYSIFLGTVKVYEQILTGNSITNGDIVSWFFNHPLEGRTGQGVQIKLEYTKKRRVNRRLLVQAAPGTLEPTEPYVKLFYRMFEDICLLPHPNTAVPYWGDPADLQPGWFICDGTNGTPDLRGQFIRGASNPAEVLTTHTNTTRIPDSVTIEPKDAFNDVSSDQMITVPGVFNKVWEERGRPTEAVSNRRTVGYTNTDIVYSGNLWHDHEITGGDSETAPDHILMYWITYLGEFI